MPSLRRRGTAGLADRPDRRGVRRRSRSLEPRALPVVRGGVARPEADEGVDHARVRALPHPREGRGGGRGAARVQDGAPQRVSATRWGYALEPAWSWGRHVLTRERRAAIDLSVRHLPRPPAKARLLDVGCGNGAFLAHMRRLGWEVHGLEPDPDACAAAAAAGIDVSVGTLADVTWPEATFQAVTMSTVLEHLPDPRATLQACRRLLAPGGMLHIVTPNTEALGAERFGAHWRGLEAPRHLVLFNRSGVDAAARRLRLHRRRLPSPVGGGVVLARQRCDGARRAARPVRARSRAAVRDALRREGRAADKRVMREPERAEELVVTAKKPGAAA